MKLNNYYILFKISIEILQASTSAVKHISDAQYDEHKKLQEKWHGCNTRLVAL